MLIQPDFSKAPQEDYTSDWCWRKNQLTVDTLELYEWALSVGIEKEEAQKILPRGLVP